MAAIVMMGGMLESLLLARVNQLNDKSPVFKATNAPKDHKTGATLKLNEWGLKNFLDVAHELFSLILSLHDINNIMSYNLPPMVSGGLPLPVGGLRSNLALRCKAVLIGTYCTEARLAKELGIHQTALSRWLSGYADAGLPEKIIKNIESWVKQRLNCDPPANKKYRALLFISDPAALQMLAEFFTLNIASTNTRTAYFRIANRFVEWCNNFGLVQWKEIESLHLAAYREILLKSFSIPTVKQHLAGLRMMFDWLVCHHVIESNPALAVRGPKYSVKRGKIAVLTSEEVRSLLDSIEQDTLIGLRDRALISLMIYTFARVTAAINMRVEDYYVEGRRSWITLHEKGGKLHRVPCHHNLEQYLEKYIAEAEIADDPKGLLFRSAAEKTGHTLTKNPLSRQNVYEMIRRRAAAAGIKRKIGCHSFRATGITAYLKNGGKLEVAQQIAAHESSRTTKRYARTADEITLDEVERIGI